jgi:RNA polymerase sigma factor (sigma-70 family)
MLSLSHSEQAARVTAWRDHGDQRALAELVLANQGMVKQLAKRYHRERQWPESEDLEAEGQVGIMIAVQRWRPDGGSSFPSYCFDWVRNRIAEFANTQRTTITIRRGSGPLRQDARGRCQKKAGTLPGYPTVGSLYDPVRLGSKTRLIDSLEAPDWQRRLEAGIDVQRLLSHARPVDRRVIERMFLVGDDPTEAQVAADLGLQAGGSFWFMKMRALREMRAAA